MSFILKPDDLKLEVQKFTSHCLTFNVIILKCILSSSANISRNSKPVVEHLVQIKQMMLTLQVMTCPRPPVTAVAMKYYNLLHRCEMCCGQELSTSSSYIFFVLYPLPSVKTPISWKHPPLRCTHCLCYCKDDWKSSVLLNQQISVHFCKDSVTV